MNGSLKRIGVAAALALGLGACSGLPPEHRLDPFGDVPVLGALPSQTKTEEGKKYYRDGDYGLAEQAFRKAVEEDHNNAEAWLGLAASYDQLKRFDLADRAYDVLVKQVGYTPSVLNNLGYHQLLQGDRAAAERNFRKAHNADPGNLYAQNNLLLMEDPDHAPDPWMALRTQ
jgi:Flp pilus assembly protein TadD